jgi:hypothetical protein
MGPRGYSGAARSMGPRLLGRGGRGGFRLNSGIQMKTTSRERMDIVIVSHGGASVVAHVDLDAAAWRVPRATAAQGLSA